MPQTEFDPPSDDHENDELRRRLHLAETSIRVMGQHHHHIANQIAELVVSQQSLVKEQERIRNEIPALVAQGVVDGVKASIADKETMQALWGSALAEWMNRGTRAAGDTMVGWLKGALFKLMPWGVLLLIAYSIGGKALLIKLLAWLTTDGIN